MQHKALMVRLGIYCIVVIVLAAGLHAAWPPSHATIEVGPVGGSFYQTAMLYRQILAERGIDLEVRPKANSLEILGDLADPQSGIDIGFEAQDASAYLDSHVYSIGSIQLQPLFVFASADLGRRIALSDLRGHKIVMPPENSATSDAAIRMFKLYDITADNSSFSFMQLGDAAKALRAGQFDAGVFMLAPENDVVRDLTHWSGVRLVSLSEAKAIANHLPSLRPIVLPRGIYDIADGIPPADVTMVAGTVEVVVRQGLHPYLIYSLLQAMSEVHRGSTLVSSAGAYPSIAGTDLPVYPLAQEYHRSGVPWEYRHLPAPLAAFVDRYLVLALLLFAVVELYRFAHYLGELGTAFLARRPRRKEE
jgi:TRAP-type uncharacterized transport system substrate-binding protein